MWPQNFLHVREENYERISLTEVDKSCRCPLSPVATFSIADPAFTKANKASGHLKQTSGRQAKLAVGVVHEKPFSNEQMKKLFDSDELGPVESKNLAQLERTIEFYLCLFLEGESDAKIVSVPNSETGL